MLSVQNHLYDPVGDRLNESTRLGAIDASAGFTRTKLTSLERAATIPI